MELRSETYGIPFRQENPVLPGYIFLILPRVKRLLANWEHQAARCPDPVLREQALASLRKKAFHCWGGSVYAAGAGSWKEPLLDLIVAYQTLCDYLDNLCDRAGVTDGAAFLQLHQSLRDALSPDSGYHDYYGKYPLRCDGGYINTLIDRCRRVVNDLPSYNQVRPAINDLIQWYVELQVNKHLAWDRREDTLKGWAETEKRKYPDIRWQEFAAATGSTLAVFALMRLATRPRLDTETVRQTVNGYFPWICGLHILLDYYIDQAEDRAGGDLNFVFYYPDKDIMLKRLRLFTAEAIHSALLLPESRLHVTVVNGLLAMYLSDRKIKQQHYQKQAALMLDEGGASAWRTYRICRTVRTVL